MLAARIEGAARVGEQPRQPEPLAPPKHADAEETGEAGQHLRVARVRARALGPSRRGHGRVPRVVGARVGAFPIAAGWGMGW